MTIRQVTVHQPEYEAVKQLRYRICVQEEGLDIPGTDHAAQTLAEALDADSFILADFDDQGTALATLRMTPLAALPAHDPQRALFAVEQFELPESQMFVLGRLMVEAPHRGTAICMKLMTEVYRHAFQRGFEIAFLACRPRQLPLYESVGCRRYRGVVPHPLYGLLLPMVHLLRDLEYAQQMPLALHTADLAVTHHPALAEWFGRRFGEQARRCSVRTMEPSDRHALLATLEASRCELFREIPREDLPWVLKTAAALQVPAGAPLLPRGNRGSELYVLLQGRVDMRIAGCTQAAVRLHPGQVFAEAGFLWDGLHASELEITAVDELQLLSISTEAFGPTGSARPQVALRFYRGLCKVLALRLMGLHRHSPADPALAGFSTHPAERRNERLLGAQAGLVEQGLELRTHRAHRGAPHQGDAPGRQALPEQV